MNSPITQSRSSARQSQRGYILVTLLLFVALLAISLTALAPVLSQQLKRDREEELIHRGTQYSRAIKHYMKKFNRYPMSIGDLEDSNQVRFLRKRFKDPETGKDFKLLHQGEVAMSSGGGIAGGVSAASLAAGAGNGLNANGNSFGGGSFGASNGNSFGNSGGFGSNSGGFGGNSGGFGGFGNSGNSFGGNQGGFGNSGTSPGGNQGGFGFGGGNPGNAPFGGQTPNQSNNSEGTQTENNGSAPGTPNGQGGFGQPVQNLGGFGAQNGNPVIGGGPIVGVASTSKKESIRSFGGKDHYNDWQFIYDPTMDRGGLITTPYQAQTVKAQNVNGVPGTQANPAGNGGQVTPPSQFGFGGGAQPGGGGPNPMQPQMPPEQAPQ